MTAKPMHAFGMLALLLLAPLPLASQPPAAPGPALVNRALAAELHNVRDSQFPMRFVLRKSSPRFTSTKVIVESKDGSVARLVAVNGQPLSATDQQHEQARLDALLQNPDSQRHRKEREDADAQRAIKVLRALPAAFHFEFAGREDGPEGTLDRFNFTPDPAYNPPDLETLVLTAMSGQIWIDPVQGRVVRLRGQLQRDVNIGWGILGKLDKGGWILIEQADVGEHQWRVVRFQMQMTGRIFFRSKSFDTLEEETHFAPVPVGLSYQQAIRMLRSDPLPQPLPGR
ncbi:MAG TPA: hypothetical protein VMV57_04950 [Terracidiphilus sp.]|nr:hypothetical protein [Terracidiphilus sp.]